jgi:hypothetical protein
MSDADALENISDEMQAILSRFKQTRDGNYIADGDQAKFTGLVLQAREIFKDALGIVGNFDLQLEFVRTDGIRNFVGSQSYHSVEEAIGIVRGAIGTIHRRAAKPTTTGGVLLPLYVTLDRINELRVIGSTWDLRRLIRMCEEINSTFSAGSFLSVAMLLRAITDHVPPIFSATSFKHYVSQISGKSHRGSMEHLEQSLRNIADGILHVQIRDKEGLPTASQVDFRQDLDVLLGEVVRTLR